MVVGVTKICAQRNRVTQPGAQIRAFQRVGVSIVHARSVRVELVAEKVVIENSTCPRQRSLAARASEISTVRAEKQFRSSGAAGSSPHLHHARHRIRSIQCALRATHELHAIALRQRESSEIKRAAGFVDSDAVDNDFVVIRLAAAHEQRSQPSMLAGGIDDCAGKKPHRIVGRDGVQGRQLLTSESVSVRTRRFANDGSPRSAHDYRFGGDGEMKSNGNFRLR